MAFIDQQFRLVLHKVDEKRLQFRVRLVRHLQERAQLLADPDGKMLSKGCEFRELVGAFAERL